MTIFLVLVSLREALASTQSRKLCLLQYLLINSTFIPFKQYVKAAVLFLTFINLLLSYLKSGEFYVLKASWLLGDSLMKKQSTPDFILELAGYRLTTIEIVYSLPDHPDLLQVFIWQTLDIAPKFPRSHAFLHYWKQNIEGRLISISVSQKGALKKSTIQFAKDDFFLS